MLDRVFTTWHFVLLLNRFWTHKWSLQTRSNLLLWSAVSRGISPSQNQAGALQLVRAPPYHLDAYWRLEPIVLIWAFIFNCCGSKVCFSLCRNLFEQLNTHSI